MAASVGPVNENDLFSDLVPVSGPDGSMDMNTDGLLGELTAISREPMREAIYPASDLGPLAEEYRRDAGGHVNASIDRVASGKLYPASIAVGDPDGASLPVEDLPASPEYGPAKPPLSLPIEGLPVPADSPSDPYGDMYGLWDNATDQMREMTGSPEALQELLRLKDRDGEYLRRINGRMETAAQLSLTLPDQETDIVRMAVRARMTEDEVRYWQRVDPKYLNRALEGKEIVEKSGPAGYVTGLMQQPTEADKIRQDAVALANMEADAIELFGDTRDRVLYDIRSGVGQVGSLGVKALGGVAQAALDLGEWGGMLDAESQDQRRFAVDYWRNLAAETSLTWTGRPLDTGNPATDWLRTAIFQGTPFLAASAGLAMIPGVGPAGSAAIIGSAMGAETYGNSRAAGVSPLISAAAAGATAVSSYYLNKFQLDRWTRNLGGRRPFGRFSVGALVETAQEYGSEFAESMAQTAAEATAKLIGTPNYTRMDWWREVKEGFFEANQEGAAAGALTLATHFIPGLPRAVRNEGRARRFDKRFKRSGETAAQTTLYQKGNYRLLADTLNGTAKHQGGAGVVFSSIADLEQGPASRAQVIEQLRITPAEYDYAKANNVDLAVGYGDALVFAQRQKDAGNDYYQNIFKVDPDAVTGREIIAQENEMRATLEVAEAHFLAMEADDESKTPQRIRVFRAGLRAAGYDAEQADASAAVFWARADRAAELWGISPEEWLERKDVQLEFRQALGRAREMDRYVKLIEEGRMDRDAALRQAGMLPEVFDAESSPQAEAAPEAAQGPTTELTQPAITPEDNEAWLDAAADGIMSEMRGLGIEGEQAEQIREAIRSDLAQGIDDPDFRAIAERLGIKLPAAAVETESSETQGIHNKTADAAARVRQLKTMNPLDLNSLPPADNKAAVENLFRGFGPVINDADRRVAFFPVATAGKVITHRGFDFKKIAAACDRLFEESIPMFTEVEIAKEGHKPHTNVAAYHHYAAKFTQNDERGSPRTYYVRFTLREMKSKKTAGDNYVHSAFVSDVSIYDESALSAWSRENPVITESGAYVDDKLAQWLASANPEAENGSIIEELYQSAEKSGPEIPAGRIANRARPETGSPIRDTLSQWTSFVKESPETLSQAAESGSNARGAIAFPRHASAPTIIRLLQNHDVSTVIHELNHLFVEDLRQLLAQGKGNDQARADWAALSRFTNGDLESPDPKRRAAGYERIAEAWERYAMGGRAPSPDLIDAFNTFRTYIGRAYRGAAQAPEFEALPEVRAVFDRFLATDLQMEEARRVEEIGGQWWETTIQDEARRDRLRQSGKRADEARRHRADVAAGGGRALRRKADWNAIRARIRGEAANQPVYRAVTRAKNSGGFSRAEVEALIGKAGADEIARRHEADIFGEGASLDETAYNSGYSSVSEMLADMARLENEDVYVEQRLSEAVDRENMESAAAVDGESEIAADGGDEEAEYLTLQVEEAMREQGAGEKALREWRLKRKAMQDVVERLVDSKTMHDAVDVRRYEKAKRDAAKGARRASGQAAAARQAGNAKKSAEYDAKLAQFLEQELLHHLTIREIQRARALRERVITEWGTRGIIRKLQVSQYQPKTEDRSDKPPVDIRTGAPKKFVVGQFQAKVEDAYAESVKQIVEFAGLSKSRRTRPAVDSETLILPTPEAGSNMAAFLPDLAGTLPTWLLTKTRPDGFQTYMDFTYDQLKEIDRALTMLVNQGRGKLNAMRDLGAEHIEELVEKSIAPMARRERREAKVDRDDRTWLGRVYNHAVKYLNSLTCPEYWFMMMDGNPTIRGEEAGINQRMFWKMRDCQTQKDKLYKGMLARLEPAFEQFAKAREELEARFGGRTFVDPELEVPEVLRRGRNRPTWDADMLLSIAWQMGNDANLFSLTSEEQGYGFTQEQLNHIAAQFSADTWKAIQSMWDAIDSLYPQLDAVTFKLTNRHMVKELAQRLTVVTSDGQTLDLKGGYFPKIYDPLLSEGAQKYSNIEDAIQAGHSYATHQSIKPANGTVNERQRDENGKPLVGWPTLLQTNVLVRHLDVATHYISHAESLMEMDRMTRDERWKTEFVDKFGAARYANIRNWLQDLARPNRTNNSPGQQIMEHMRGLATINALGLRPTTAFKQLLGLGQAATFMTDASRTGVTGWKYIKKGWREIGWGAVVGRKTEKMAWVDSVSDFMSARDGSHDREIKAMVDRISPMQSALFTNPITGNKVTRTDIHNGTFALIQAVDRLGAYTTWIGAYEQAMAGDANFDIAGMTDEQRHREAVKYADSAAATQASSFAADLTEAQRDTGIMRFVSMFMSGNIRQGSRLMQYIDAAKLGDKSKAQVAFFILREFVAPALAWVLTGSAVKYAISGGDDDDLLAEAAWEVLETSIAPFPIAREIPSWLRYGADGTVPALSAPAKSITKGVRGAKRLTDGEYAKATGDLLDSLGFWLGMPVMNAWRQARPLTDAAGLTERKNR